MGKYGGVPPYLYPYVYLHICLYVYLHICLYVYLQICTPMSTAMPAALCLPPCLQMLQQVAPPLATLLRPRLLMTIPTRRRWTCLGGAPGDVLRTPTSWPPLHRLQLLPPTRGASAVLEPCLLRQLLVSVAAAAAKTVGCECGCCC